MIKTKTWAFYRLILCISLSVFVCVCLCLWVCVSISLSIYMKAYTCMWKWESEKGVSSLRIRVTVFAECLSVQKVGEIWPYDYASNTQKGWNIFLTSLCTVWKIRSMWSECVFIPCNHSTVKAEECGPLSFLGQA